MDSPTQPPYLSRMQYAGAVAAYVLVAFGLTAALLSQQYGAGAASFAIWCTSPVFWWACWAMRRRSRSRAYQRSAFVIAALLAVALPLFHVVATSAAQSSSAGGMAYLTIPLVLLVATMIATWAGGAAASISERNAETA